MKSFLRGGVFQSKNLGGRPKKDEAEPKYGTPVVKIVETTGNSFEPKVAETATTQYRCADCGFETTTRAKFDCHLSTKKHRFNSMKNNTETPIMELLGKVHSDPKLIVVILGKVLQPDFTLETFKNAFVYDNLIAQMFEPDYYEQDKIFIRAFCKTYRDLPNNKKPFVIYDDKIYAHYGANKWAMVERNEWVENVRAYNNRWFNIYYDAFKGHPRWTDVNGILLTLVTNTAGVVERSEGISGTVQLPQTLKMMKSGLITFKPELYMDIGSEVVDIKIINCERGHSPPQTPTISEVAPEVAPEPAPTPTPAPEPAPTPSPTPEPEPTPEHRLTESKDDIFGDAMAMPMPRGHSPPQTPTINEVIMSVAPTKTYTPKVRSVVDVLGSRFIPDYSIDTFIDAVELDARMIGNVLVGSEDTILNILISTYNGLEDDKKPFVVCSGRLYVMLSNGKWKETTVDKFSVAVNEFLKCLADVINGELLKHQRDVERKAVTEYNRNNNQCYSVYNRIPSDWRNSDDNDFKDELDDITRAKLICRQYLELDNEVLIQMTDEFVSNFSEIEV